jgi:flagellar hook-length control protein FliK
MFGKEVEMRTDDVLAVPRTAASPPISSSSRSSDSKSGVSFGDFLNSASLPSSPPPKKGNDLGDLMAGVLAIAGQVVAVQTSQVDGNPPGNDATNAAQAGQILQVTGNQPKLEWVQSPAQPGAQIFQALNALAGAAGEVEEGAQTASPSTTALGNLVLFRSEEPKTDVVDAVTILASQEKNVLQVEVEEDGQNSLTTLNSLAGSLASAAGGLKETRLSEGGMVRVEARDLVARLGHEITDMAQDGRTSLRIQLEPENMGRIDVRLVSGNDGVHVVMTAENANTSRLLESQLSNLRNNLSAAGIQLGGMSVGSQGAQNHFAGQNFANPVFMAASLSSALGRDETVTETRQRVVATASGLDWRA